MASDYREQYERSLRDREAFWADAARAVDWTKAPERVLDASRPPFYRWFPDGITNTCHNALDRHVDAGRGADAALIYESPVTDTTRVLSFGELRDEVAQFAGALAGQSTRSSSAVSPPKSSPPASTTPNRSWY